MKNEKKTRNSTLLNCKIANTWKFSVEKPPQRRLLNRKFFSLSLSLSLSLSHAFIKLNDVLSLSLSLSVFINYSQDDKEK
jgi:hypothetical protein